MNVVNVAMSNVKAKCPICGGVSDPKYMPFCSKHCADVDLGRWLKGVYVVHTNEIPEGQELSAEQDEK